MIRNNVRMKQTSGCIDPILSLSLPREATTGSGELGRAGRFSSITSLCFLPTNSSTGESHVGDDSSDTEASHPESQNEDDSESDGDGSEPLAFQCRALAATLDGTGGSVHRSFAALGLSDRRLISAHGDGSTILWDLGQQQRAAASTDTTRRSLLENRGPVRLLRRVDPAAQLSRALLYQTRDDRGTVSLHDGGRDDLPLRAKLETHSQTFCTACPCYGRPDLVALPAPEDSVAVVRDWRMAGESLPIATLQNSSERENNGMLMSLGFVETAAPSATLGTGRSIVACGMESGRVLWYDLAMPSVPIAASSPPSTPASIHSSCSLKLARDPILCLDMVPSTPSAVTESGADVKGAVAIAGMAAHRSDLLQEGEHDEQNIGTVALLKVTHGANTDGDTLQTHIRGRRATCQLDASKSVGAGKPGVGSCRFRPDGRIFAVGGWDKRLRLFDRAGSANLLAILRGHADSVNALDWAEDAAESGLLASGGDDGRIHVWQCFAKRPLY